ncbi:MAG: hypothetical protein RIT02_394 [Planctomycetota bacterium]
MSLFSDWEVSNSAAATLPGGGESSGFSQRDSAAGGLELQSAEAEWSSVCPAVTEDVWKRLHRGLEQWFQAVSSLLNCLAAGQKLPSELERLLSGSRRQQFDRWQSSYAYRGSRAVTWLWPGAVDVMLQVDGSLQIMDCDLSLPSGLERLRIPNCRSVSDSKAQLRQQLFGLGGFPWGSGRVVLLDPNSSCASGRCNEFLSWLLDAQLVTTSDLSVERGEVRVRHGKSWLPVDAVIRRVDDELLDPNCGRPDSLVGVPGLVRSWQSGLVSVFNPPGTGLLRCRSVAALIPECIRVFLGQQPLLDTAPALSLEDPVERTRIFRNAGHYAIRTDDPMHPARPWFGGSSDLRQLEQLRRRIDADPSRWIARPLPVPNPGRLNLRFFGSLHRGFSLLPGTLIRSCEVDGGARMVISEDTDVQPVWRIRQS